MAQMKMLNAEYIKDLQERANKAEVSVSKRKFRFRLFTFGAVVLCICVALLIIRLHRSSIEKTYNSFISGDDYTLTLDLLQYRDIYSVYETLSMGNSNSNLLIGGYFADQNGIIISPNEELTDTLFISNGHWESLFGELCSYVNVTGDSIYFRKNSDRRIYAKSIVHGNADLIIDRNVGQFAIADGKAYYIDIGSRVLYVCSLDSLGDENAILSDVSSFAVFQDYIIYLTEYYELFLHDMRDGSKSLLSDNIEKFFFIGDIVAQSNQSIIQFDLAGKSFRKVEIPETDSVSLVYAHSGLIYIQIDRTLYSLDAASMQWQECRQGYDLYLSVFLRETQVQAITVIIDRPTESITRGLIDLGGRQGE